MSIRTLATVASLALAAPVVAQEAPVAPLATAPAAAPLSLDLECMGRGTMHKMEQVPDGKDKKGKPRTRTHSYDEPFRGVARIRIRGDVAEALPPEPMLAQARESGWRKIKKLAISERAIDGKIDLGFLYAPVFHIDRYAGTLSIDGSMNSFEGQCRAFDASERQF